jgi:hypothetical protein
MGVEATKEDRAKPRRRARDLTPAQRAEAETLWKGGDITLEQLSVRFKKTPEYLSRYFSAKGIKKGEDAAKRQAEVREQVAKAMVQEAQVLAGRIKDTKEEHYKLSALMAKLIQATIVKAHNDKVSIATTLNDMKALQTAAAALRTIREERYALLGLNEQKEEEEETIPDLVVREVSTDEIDGMRTTLENDLGDSLVSIDKEIKDNNQESNGEE